MARGDAYTVAATSTADDAYLAFQPSGADEIVLHNIYVPFGSAVEVYWYDGTNEILIDSGTESYIGFNFHCTNSHYVRVKNVSGGTIRLAGDGMYTA